MQVAVKKSFSGKFLYYHIQPNKPIICTTFFDISVPYNAKGVDQDQQLIRIHIFYPHNVKPVLSGH